MATLDIAAPAAASTDNKVSYYGVHHLALNTDDMKMTVDFMSTCSACGWFTP